MPGRDVARPCAAARRGTRCGAGFSSTPSMRTLGVGQDERGHHQERGAGGVAGDVDGRAAGRRAPPSTDTVSPVALAPATPNAGSSRSVWSRLGAGSRTVVRPSACRPASRTAVFTCALGTGRVPVDAVSGAAVDGQRRPAVGRCRCARPSRAAARPRARRAAGAATRRRSAPSGTAARPARRPACAASSPSCRRRAGRRRRAQASGPAADDRHRRCRRAGPRRRGPARQRRVDAQSAAVEKLRDPASPRRPGRPGSPAGGESDLSPGRVKRPRKRRAETRRGVREGGSYDLTLRVDALPRATRPGAPCYWPPMTPSAR